MSETFVEAYARRTGKSPDVARADLEEGVFWQELHAGQFTVAFLFLAALGVWLWLMWGMWL